MSTTPASTQASVLFDASWRAIMECAAKEVFEMMAGVSLQPYTGSSEIPRGEQTAMVGMAGALCGITTLRCSRASSTKLAALMLRGDSPPTVSTSRDALGELCNMIAGNFKAKIGNLGDRCFLSVPTVITGEDYFMETVEPRDSITVALAFEGQPIWIALFTHK
jgi:chemotaxis protein CheX